MAAWQAAREEVIKPEVANHSGNIVKLTGDGFLVEFSTVQDAVNCAIAMQRDLASSSLDFRMGVNLGDIVDDGEDIHGEGINVAARLEGLADPGGICISGDVYNQVRNRVDASLEDMGQQEVKNVSAPVQVYAVRLDGSAAPSASGAPAISDKPSIAVLPFDNMSGDANQEYFVDGITEDIITVLSKNRWLSVIARNSSFGYKGQSPDVRRVAEELGADFVVEGSIRKVGDRVRVAVQLIDAETGNHIWAERYDRDLEDIFAVQDEITETIAGRIEPELGAVERQRVQRKPPQNLDVWDCYHLGLSYMYRFTKEGNAEALRLLRRVIEMDPNFAAAHSSLAYSMVLDVVYFGADPTAEYLDEALRIAEKGVMLDERDGLAHFVLGRVQLVRCEYDLSIAELETAIELNPCLAQAHCGLGDSLAYAGRLTEAIPRFEEAVRLSPHDPHKWAFLMYGALALLLMKKYEAAEEWARESIRAPNSTFWANAHLVSALGHLGRTNEARAAMKDLLRKEPEFSSIRFAKRLLFYIKDPSQKEHYLDGLRKAGLAE